MTIAEFSSNRGVKEQTVSMYMRRCGMRYDKAAGLSEDQLEVLDKQYPLPKPVTVIEGIPKEQHYQELHHKDEEIQALQQRIVTLTEQAAKVQLLEEKAARLELLEEREAQKDRRIEELTAQAARVGDLEELLKQETARRFDRDQELRRLKARSLWDRIWNIC